jgi:hypothetical protein
MANIFQNIRFKSSKRYTYDLSHQVKASMKIGQLYPILRMDVLPGDKFNVNTQHVLKLQPMLAPIMHSIDVKVDYFYVPYRLLSKGFNDFVLGIDQTAVPPYITMYDCLHSALNQVKDPGYNIMLKKMQVGTLWDFLGYPTLDPPTKDLDDMTKDELIDYCESQLDKYGNNVKLSALPILAFRSIWSNYYRWYAQPEDSLWEEQIKQDPNISHTVMSFFSIYENAKWERDYFTSALDSPQAGVPASISIGGMADLVQTDLDDVTKTSKVSAVDISVGGSGEWESFGSTTLYSPAPGSSAGTVNYTKQSGLKMEGTALARVDVTPHTKADLTDATPVDVEVLREAFILQRIREVMQAGGSKPIDRLKSLWGVNSSDARLQIPEYLGGGRSPLVISSVLQQSQNSSEGYQLGRQAGEGLSVGKASAFNRYFEEHGCVIGIMRIVPRTSYYQGVHRDLLRVAFGDFALPQFSVLGEQAIKNCELYFSTDKPEDTFGYQSRYADYKYIPDKVHGEFKTSLAYWHMARKFEQLPVLNKEFQDIDSKSVQSSVFTIPGEDTVYCDIYHKITAKRKLKPNVY